MLHQLRHVVVVALVVFVLETPSVAGKFKNDIFSTIFISQLIYAMFNINIIQILGRLMWGECKGLRLENALSIPAKDCISLGGKCCDLGQMSKSIDKII
jgi:hypothetical protein